MKMLSQFVHSRWYWGAILCVALALEAVGLFYQHVLGEPPCVLCVQYRAWILAGAAFGLLGLALHKITALRLIAQLGVLGCLIKMALITRTLLLVERGQYEGSCGMDPGFPAWMPLDAWFPNVFEVWTMCGYTPNFLFGLTMGEGQFIATLILIAIAIAALALMLLKQFKSQR